MLKYASQWRVPLPSKTASTTRINDDETNQVLNNKLSELLNAAVLFTTASQHPSRIKKPKLDFFYIHSLNSSIFYPTLLSSTALLSITPAQKARLLEWKGRMDLAIYASRGAPELFHDEIRDYQSPRRHDHEQRGGKATNGGRNALANGNGSGAHKTATAAWAAIFARARSIQDDGHASKAIRAIAYAETLPPLPITLSPTPLTPSAAAPTEPGTVKLITPDMFLPAAQLAMDSVEDLVAGEPQWVRDTGFEEAWRGIPERD